MFHALMTMADESVRQMQATQARLLETVAQGPAGTPDHARLALVPLKHLNACHGVLGHLAARQMRVCQGLLAAALSPLPDASVLADVLEMQQAIARRLAAQQARFLADLGDIAAGAGNMKQANTLSKLMDQEYDFFARIHALLVGQASALVELMENVQIGYGYLLTRRIEGAAP
jgi:hypothetical protein